MLDFFKETYLEMNGVDTQVVKSEKEKKKEIEKESRYIFSKKAKIICIIMGIIYLIIAGVEIACMIYFSSSLLFLIKIFIQMIIDISAIVCLILKEKKYERIALVLIGLFLLIGYMSVFMI